LAGSDVLLGAADGWTRLFKRDGLGAFSARCDRRGRLTVAFRVAQATSTLRVVVSTSGRRTVARYLNPGHALKLGPSRRAAVLQQWQIGESTKGGSQVTGATVASASLKPVGGVGCEVSIQVTGPVRGP
jgi:hypothetical protein